MKNFIGIIVFFISASANAQDCEVLTLDQEIQLTQNIALVTVGGIIRDSIEVNVVKKWKGDSINNQFLVAKETLFSDYILFDSSKT
jgi:hypothetical protein